MWGLSDCVGPHCQLYLPPASLFYLQKFPSWTDFESERGTAKLLLMCRPSRFADKIDHVSFILRFKRTRNKQGQLRQQVHFQEHGSKQILITLVNLSAFRDWPSIACSCETAPLISSGCDGRHPQIGGAAQERLRLWVFGYGWRYHLVDMVYLGWQLVQLCSYLRPQAAASEKDELRQ